MEIVQSLLDLVIKFVSQIILLAAGAIVNHYINKYKRRAEQAETAAAEIDKRQSALEIGMQALLRDAIMRQHRYCKQDKCISAMALDNVEKMYTSYHELGGNGMVTGVIEEIRQMPIETR